MTIIAATLSSAFLWGSALLCCLTFPPKVGSATANDHTSWNTFGGSSDSAQYSALRQINRSNVKNLRVAWRYSTGDNSRYSFNPLFANGMVYVLAKNNSLVALDAITGKEIWVHPSPSGSRLITYRGIDFWESDDKRESRLFFSQDNFLQALDARTGKRITSFGLNGSVDLRAGLGRNPEDVVLVQSNSPGRVFEHLLILGSSPNQEYESAPGDIRAFDVRSGALVWSFHTVPHPGEFGYDTWPKNAWRTVGGANAWSELSIDKQRGIVYVPTGSPKYNFYGADRLGANLFGDCLLALDARTGKRLWHFQMVHHDIWDYDNATEPKLLTVRHNGQMIDAVAEAGKTGFLYVFNRITGEPLWPIEERPVPSSDMPGEQTSATQPFPVKPPPFARQKFTADDLSPFITDAAERANFRDELLSARNEGLFTPPGLRNTVEMPGNNGGANWGGAAADPNAGLLFIVSKDLPAMLKLEPETALRIPANGSPEQQGLAVYHAKCQVCHHADLKGQPPAVPSLVNVGSRFSRQQVDFTVHHGQALMPAISGLSAVQSERLLDFLFSDHPVAELASDLHTSEPVTRYRSGFGFMITKAGLSPIKPPWTSLTAYDLNTGDIKWKIPLGDVSELAVQGIHGTGSHFPKVGPVVTAGGLIFTGTRDRMVRALDEQTGTVLWETQVDAGLEGMPAVYEADGREYIVFCAAAQSATNLYSSPAKATSSTGIQNGAYVAFALPQQ